MSPLQERIRDHVAVSENGCWIWQASLYSEGYGRLKVDRRTRLAHRVSYEERFGPVPDGLVLDHLCRNRRCVNPEHLEPVTVRENTLRGATLPALNAVKTHCPQRHEYTSANTRIGHKGKRACRTCDRERMRRRTVALAPQAGDGAR